MGKFTETESRVVISMAGGRQGQRGRLMGEGSTVEFIKMFWH